MSQATNNESDAESDFEFDSDSDPEMNYIAPEPKQKSYQVPFNSMSIESLNNQQTLQIEHVSGIIGCSLQVSATLLRHFKWNKELLIEQYMDNQQKVIKEAGVNTNLNDIPVIKNTPNFCCGICYDDGDDKTQTFALQCEHRYCIDCYSRVLNQKIIEEGESRGLKCPGEKCTMALGSDSIKLLVDESVFEKYNELLLKSYVEDSVKIRWCPAPNCDYAIECGVKDAQLTLIIPSVKCACEYEFCFGCSSPDHMPCPCEIHRLWQKKCADDSETSNWIQANTKECSQCHTMIEKNGGCNHMSCRKCKYEFCWVCMGPWSEHGGAYYNCNRYEEKSGVEARNAQDVSRANLKRYLHYHDRYTNHANSAKLDKDLYTKTERKMDLVQRTSTLSWIEVQFLQKAVSVLLESRFTLKWTYAFAYYLAKNNHTELFEDNQRDLEMAVEQLSGLLETDVTANDILALKQQVIDKSVYVSSRREVLLEDTTLGLSEGRWKYNV